MATRILDQTNNDQGEHLRAVRGLVFYKQTRLYVPDGPLRRALIQEHHDTPVAGHRGAGVTYSALKDDFYWPNMRNDVQRYVASCFTCQQNKSERRNPAGLLQPLPIPDRPFQVITMDFITGFPKVRNIDAVLVVVCRFSKVAHFIPTQKNADAREAARLVFHEVVRVRGMPEQIISDRDSRFTGRFWRALFQKYGTTLSFSSSHHPQTDGQSEILNQQLEQYLRMFIQTDQKDWPDHLDTAELCYNNSFQEAIRMTPFELLHGRKAGISFQRNAESQVTFGNISLNS